MTSTDTLCTVKHGRVERAPGINHIVLTLCLMHPTHVVAEAESFAQQGASQSEQNDVTGIALDGSFTGPEISNSFAPMWLPSYGVGISIGGGGVLFPENVRNEEMISSPAGFTLGFDLSLWRFLVLDFGLGWMWAADHARFSEAACSVLLTSVCETGSSQVGGFQGWLQTGPQVRIFVPLGNLAVAIAARGTVGVRGVALRREVKFATLNCTDCTEEHIQAGGGLFVSPGIELAYAFGDRSDAGAVGIRGAYEYYLTGDPTSGLWLSGFFAGFF